MRNQSDYVDTNTLTRNQIYILPSRAGICLTGLLFAMLLTSLNYMSSMAMMFTFFVGSAAFIAAFYTHRNLHGLKIRRTPQDRFFVGDAAYFKIAVDNESKLPRYGVIFRERNDNLILHNIPAQSSIEVKMPITPTRRGEFRLRRFDIASRTPVGLFNAWSWQTLKTSIWVYPSPIPNHPAPVLPAGDAGEGAMSMVAGEEFSSLREYTPGDPMKHIAWKQQARHGRLLTKEFNENLTGNSSIFNWDCLQEESRELRLAYLCYWVLEAERSQYPYGLELPGTSIPLNRGEQHLDECLLALAEFSA